MHFLNVRRLRDWKKFKNSFLKTRNVFENLIWICYTVARRKQGFDSLVLSHVERSNPHAPWPVPAYVGKCCPYKYLTVLTELTHKKWRV